MRQSESALNVYFRESVSRLFVPFRADNQLVEHAKMGNKFTEKMTMAETAKVGPEARKVIEKHFGKDCFSCPSFSVEPLFMGARMHAVELNKLLKDLNSTA